MVFTKPFFTFLRPSTLPSLRDTLQPSGTCHSHLRPLMIYCTTCTDSLCDECLIQGDHHRHALARFKDVLQKHIEEVTRRSKQLTSSLKKQVDTKTSAAKAKTHAEEMFEQTRVNLEKQYEELQELLDHNKEQAFRLFLAQKESLLQGLDTLVLQDEQNQQTMANMEQELLQLKSSLDCESPAALLKIKELDTK
ncbi:tripartite motif-containing protein 59-like [Scleropages formosus]|uniref:tripartite motif-containing protein 59-like n=1 Tax=Scleropages formosus TaxID=113540 RepID=UPI0008785407|nr:tripartite motif-containing protein 59-like [Scleropages formosus]